MDSERAQGKNEAAYEFMGEEQRKELENSEKGKWLASFVFGLDKEEFVKHSNYFRLCSRDYFGCED